MAKLSHEFLATLANVTLPDTGEAAFPHHQILVDLIEDRFECAKHIYRDATIITIGKSSITDPILVIDGSIVAYYKHRGNLSQSTVFEMCDPAYPKNVISMLINRHFDKLATKTPEKSTKCCYQEAKGKGEEALQPPRRCKRVDARPTKLNNGKTEPRCPTHRHKKYL